MRRLVRSGRIVTSKVRKFDCVALLIARTLLGTHQEFLLRTSFESLGDYEPFERRRRRW